MSTVGQVSAGTQSAIFVDSRAGIVYDIDPVLGFFGERGRRVDGSPTFDSMPGMRFLDATTLQPIGDDDLALPVRPPDPNISVVDEGHQLFYYAAYSTTDGPSIEIIDGKARKHVGSIKGLAGGAYEVAALAMSPDNRLWAAIGMSSVDRRRFPIVFELDPLAVVNGTGSGIVAQYPFVQPCEGLAKGEAFGVSRTSLYLGCNGTEFPPVGHKPGSFQGVYTLPLRDGHLPPPTQPATFFAVPGSYTFGWAMFDALSERMVLMTRDFGPRGAFVFDGKHQAMVGLIGQLGNMLGGCIDPTSGRFYGYTTSFSAGHTSTFGLLVGEIRATPAPQGYAFAEYAAESMHGHVACDYERKRVYLKRTKQGEGGPTFFYEVVRDGLSPHAPPAPPADPDLNTSDVPDDDPAAQVSFQALGRAYGARVSLVGGYSNAALNYFNADYVEYVGTRTPPQCPPDESGVSCGSLKSNVSSASRELVFGAVGDPGESASVTVSNFSVSAAANGGDRDSGTESEMARLARMGERAPDGAPSELWPYRQLLCSGSPGQEDSGTAEFGGTVTCDNDREGGPAARGLASGDGALTIPGGLPLGLSIVGGSSEVSSRTDRELGVVTTATGQVRTMALAAGDVRLELDNVVGIAEASARGAKGTAHSRYHRSIGRMRVNGIQVCGPCAPESVVDFINSLPQSHVRATLPKYDAEAFRPTPKGYQASVVRDRWEQLTDSVLNERSNYDLQVPALRLALQEDAFQHSAILIDLAAPQAEAHRGVKGCAFCDLTGGPGGEGGGGNGGAGDVPGFASIGGSIPEFGGSTTITETRPVIRFRDRRTPLQQIIDGLKVIFTSPGKLAGVLLVWSVLACPVYLASRRRLVLQRMH